MRLLTYIQARCGRWWLPVELLGPNEARILYDAAVGTLGVIVTMVFCRAYLATSGPVVRLLILPVVLMVANAALGIYARLRQASSRKKAFVLLIGVLASGAAALALGAAAGPVILWSVVVYPPLALARLLLGLPYSKHERLISIAVNHRGPVLVIGGAGYIGCHAVDLLLQAGKRVRVLDRLMYGREPLAEFANRGNFELIEGDVTDVGRLAQAMKGASAVVHLAGLVGDPACAVDPQFTRHTNIVSTRMAREVAQSVGIQRFVFASSCSVYGATDKEARETDSLNPVSLYAQTKIDSERELLRGVPDGFFVTILRFATVFGHSRRSRFDLVANLFTAQAITDGLITVIGPQQWRPFIHVRDLARAIVLVLDAAPKLIQSEIFNVGDARLNMTILQLGEKVREVCRRYRDVSISISENVQDRRNYAVSFQKIHSLLGFEAATLMDAGIEEMAAAFQDGKYGHYREQIYSNVAMTAKVLSQFQNPDELSRLYAPLR